MSDERRMKRERWEGQTLSKRFDHLDHQLGSRFGSRVKSLAFDISLVVSIKRASRQIENLPSSNAAQFALSTDSLLTLTLINRALLQAPSRNWRPKSDFATVVGGRIWRRLVG
ncbi:hypothetical protein KM043_005834 [Ampulex compressa]|nr:hypothetical protein KM043_005834 [Ampulex compressa]